MSHMTTVSCVVINDPVACRSAVEQLRREGVDCDWLENAIPRGDYSRETARYVIRVNSGSRDVGLFEKEGTSALTIKCDIGYSDISAALGVDTKLLSDEERIQYAGINYETRALGKLFQEYQTQATIRAASAKGYSPKRVKGADGNVQVLMAA